MARDLLPLPTPDYYRQLVSDEQAARAKARETSRALFALVREPANSSRLQNARRSAEEAQKALAAVKQEKLRVMSEIGK